MAHHQYAHAASQTVDKHMARNITLAVLTVLILLIGITAVFGVRFYKQAQEVKAYESQAIASLFIINDTSKLKDADASQAAIKQARQETAQAKTIAHGALWNLASKMPYIGGDIATVQGMTEIIDDLARQTLPSLVSEVQQLGNADLSGSEGQLNLQPISDAQSSFDKLEEMLEVFEENGWATCDNGRWHFTPGGFLVSNVLIGVLLESQTKEKFNANPWIREAFEARGQKVPLPTASEPYMN